MASQPQDGAVGASFSRHFRPFRSSTQLQLDFNRLNTALPAGATSCRAVVRVLAVPSANPRLVTPRLLRGLHPATHPSTSHTPPHPLPPIPPIFADDEHGGASCATDPAAQVRGQETESRLVAHCPLGVIRTYTARIRACVHAACRQAQRGMHGPFSRASVLTHFYKRICIHICMDVCAHVCSHVDTHLCTVYTRR